MRINVGNSIRWQLKVQQLNLECGSREQITEILCCLPSGALKKAT